MVKFYFNDLMVEFIEVKRNFKFTRFGFYVLPTVPNLIENQSTVKNKINIAGQVFHASSLLTR